MKKLVGLGVVLLLAYLAYTRFFNKPVPEGERELRRISRAYDEALTRYGQSNRTTGISGLDMTSDITDVVIAVEDLKKQLADLIPRLPDDQTSAGARALESRMEKFLTDKR